MKKSDILKIYRDLKHKKTNLLEQPLKNNPFKKKTGTIRPKSVCVEDAFFGDSGKGSVIVKFNEYLAKQKKMYCVRFNGGANAGHETLFNGKKIVTHQLPIGIIKEQATVLMLRGMVIHPEDLVIEVERVKKEFGGSLPGTFFIDERTPLALDTHRALEYMLNTYMEGGKGSTGRGIATAYASIYQRFPVTIKDLMSKDWKEILKKHFELYKILIHGSEYEIEDIQVPTLAGEKGSRRKVGTEKIFIDRLSEARVALVKHITSEMYDMLQKAWNDVKTPLTIEGAQGVGLDPYHGVYPDVTSSRPASRNINDATYNIILPEEIALRTAVMKTTYVSSVGQRRLPAIKDEKKEQWIQTAFDEKGRSTGRLRDIYSVTIPIAQYLKKASGYEYLSATHLDASKENQPIQVVIAYTDKKTGKETRYFPYQDALDNLEPHVVEFDGWDGEEVKKAKKPKDLPYNARVYLAFLSQTIAPVILGTTGSDIDDSIFWI